MANVRMASSTVTSAPSSSAGIRRAMKCGSNGTSVFVEVVEPLRRRILVQPLLIPGHILAVSGARAQLTHPGVQEQPPLEVAGLQEDRILLHICERCSRDIKPHEIVVLMFVEVGDGLVDVECGGTS